MIYSDPPSDPSIPPITPPDPLPPHKLGCRTYTRSLTKLLDHTYLYHPLRHHHCHRLMCTVCHSGIILCDRQWKVMIIEIQYLQ